MILAGLALLNVVRRRDSRQTAIAHHIKERGGHVVRIRPTPFAEAWFGKTDGPIFDVTYRDPRGVERQTTCKVSRSGALTWLDERRDPRRIEKLELLVGPDQYGSIEALRCPFCQTPVFRGQKRCRACRVPFVGT